MKCDSAERRQFLVLVLDVLVDPVFTAAFIWFKVQGLLHFDCLLNQQSLI